MTLTPRQRIAVYKELFRLKQISDPTPQQQARLDEMSKIFAYDGQDTCAADGMCQEKCPVKINTGELVKQLRSEDMAAMPRASKVAMVSGWVCLPACWGQWGGRGNGRVGEGGLPAPPGPASAANRQAQVPWVSQP